MAGVESEVREVAVANPSRDKGTRAERWTATALQRLMYPNADRGPLRGKFDKGDIMNTPGVCFEVKDAKTWVVPKWMRETEAERVNAKADFGILVIKMPRVGYPNAHRWLTVMDFAAALQLQVLADWRGTRKLLGAQLGAVGIQSKGVETLLKMEKEFHGPQALQLHVRQRVSEYCDGSGFWTIMRLGARCDMLLDAGYGQRAIMDGTV